RARMGRPGLAADRTVRRGPGDRTEVRERHRAAHAPGRRRGGGAAGEARRRTGGPRPLHGLGAHSPAGPLGARRRPFPLPAPLMTPAGDSYHRPSPGRSGPAGPSPEGPRPPRVAITGLGPITAVGIGVEALWQGLRRERSPIRQIRSFDASPWRSRIAAEIDDFDPTLYMDPR